MSVLALSHLGNGSLNSFKSFEIKEGKKRHQDFFRLDVSLLSQQAPSVLSDPEGLLPICGSNKANIPDIFCETVTDCLSVTG